MQDDVTARRPRHSRTRHLALAGTLVAGLVGLSPTLTSASSADTTTTTAPTTTTLPATTTTVPRTTTTVKRPVLHLPQLRAGSHGAAVLTLQKRLNAIGYWLGPPSGVFDALTVQAVYALQKAAGLRPDGVVGAATTAALSRGVKPHAKTKRGYLVEIDLRRNLLMLVKNGNVQITLNTSTGGGYSYTSQGYTSVATTPTGVFHVFRQVDAMDISPLGQLWRPKYFVGGVAIHGAFDIPPVPVSHGCVRLSIPAMNWIWKSNRIPIGTTVRVYR
jgi:lipoprotein-anchoring transpeptidase ErfK/SrfK